MPERLTAQSIKIEGSENVSEKCFQTSAVFLLVIVVATLSGGCNRAGSEAGNNPTASPSPRRKPLTAFERDLEYVRTGRFKHTYVISRPDNGLIDKDDINYLKENAPKETNQWVSTDENHRVIAGTNFEFTPEHLDALRKRFVVEDYSGR